MNIKPIAANNKGKAAMIKFEANKTYTTRLISDHTMTSQYRVISRTAKRVTLVKVDRYGHDDAAPITRSVHEFECREVCAIDGSIHQIGSVTISSDLRWIQPLPMSA